MRYPVKVEFGKNRIDGEFKLVEVISKIEEMLNGTARKKEEKER